MKTTDTNPVAPALTVSEFKNLFDLLALRVFDANESGDLKTASALLQARQDLLEAWQKSETRQADLFAARVSPAGREDAAAQDNEIQWIISRSNGHTSTLPGSLRVEFREAFVLFWVAKDIATKPTLHSAYPLSCILAIERR